MANENDWVDEEDWVDEQPAQDTGQDNQSGVEKQNILGALFNVPGAAIRSAVQGKGYTQGAIQPSQVPTFRELGAQGASNLAGNLPPSVAAPAGAVASIAGQAMGGTLDMLTNPTDMLSLLIGGGIAKNPTAQAIGKTPIDFKNEKLAGNVLNSLIKPAHKEFMFGKNPGLGVAQEGIVASNMESLLTKVDKRISLLDDAAKYIRNTPQNMNKTIDVSKVRQPLVDTITMLKKTPKTNAAEISGVQDAMDDITNLVTELDKVGLNKLNISDAYKLKDAVSKMQKWNRDTSVGTQLNKSLKKVYHIVDEGIDIAIPELKQLNSRMANLISAKQSIINRAEVLSKQEPGPTVMKLIDLPFAAMKTTAAKTTLGKLLARQLKVPK
jgi:hypothetical protein